MNIETINRETFNKLKDRMGEKFPILLNGYITDARTYIVTIGTNLPEGDIDEVIGAAHSLKSSSGLLGIAQVSAGAETLEYAAKDHKEQNPPHHHNLIPPYEELQNMFSEVESDLTTELERIKTAS